MPADNTLLLFRRAGDVPKVELRAFAKQLRDEVAQGHSFSCLITNDAELERLNRMFLGKNYPRASARRSANHNPIWKVAYSRVYGTGNVCIAVVR